MRMQLYPRGFLGGSSIDSEEFKTTPNNSGRVSNSFNFSIFQEKSHGLKSNPIINESYHALVSTDRKIRSFSFNERLYKTAFSLFNTNSLDSWMIMQESSPLFSQTQKDFIIDTFTYLKSGKRKMSVMTWLRVLNNIQYQEDSELKFSKTDLMVSLNEPIYETIARWLTFEDGLSDFITTLYILFGDIDD